MTDRLATGASRRRDAGVEALARSLSAGQNAYRNARCNLALVGAAWTTRRRDRRFRVVPFDAVQLTNIAAVLATFVGFVGFILDSSATRWRAALPEPVADAFGIFTRAGDSDWILIGASLFLIWSLARDAAAMPTRSRLAHWSRAGAALYVLSAVALSGVIAVAMKYAIGRARPKHFDEFGAYAFDFAAFDPSWSSFPSGHATTAMALAVAVGLLYRRFLPALLCAGFWLAFSRIVTGSHYPSDLAAGCLLGAGTAWLLARAFAQVRLVFGFDARGNLFRRRRSRGAGRIAG